MLGEVVRHAANGIYRIGPQVTYSISIKIHRIGAIAGRNELRISHGASIRALQATGIHFLLPGDFKESGQLTTEECPPYRMMKRQRSQRIQYTVTSGKASITGFDADNGGNHRSEEHTSELQSRGHIVCRLLLEKTKIVVNTEFCRSDNSIIVVS